MTYYHTYIYMYNDIESHILVCTIWPSIKHAYMYIYMYNDLESRIYMYTCIIWPKWPIFIHTYMYNDLLSHTYIFIYVKWPRITNTYMYNMTYYHTHIYIYCPIALWCVYICLCSYESLIHTSNIDYVWEVHHWTHWTDTRDRHPGQTPGTDTRDIKGDSLH